MADERNLEEETVEVVTLEDEDGNKIELVLVDEIDYKEGRYVVFESLEDDDQEEDETSLLVYKVEDDKEDPEIEEYIPVEDEKTLTDLWEIFEKDLEEN